MMSRSFIAAAIASLLFFARPASAQIHWDASAQVGVQKRFLASQRPGGGDAEFGPTGMLNAHLALLPLLRVGVYFGHDVSPLSDELPARQLTWGGVRAKVMSPWPRGNTRAYAFVGFGYDGVYTPGLSKVDTARLKSSGGFFEVPFGLGVSYTFWKPWALVAELGGRAGFGFSGRTYSGPTTLASFSDRPPDASLSGASGDDRFGIGLTVGVMLDR